MADPVSLIDLAPTVLDCLDVPHPGLINGRSLKPALSGEALSVRACYGVARETFLEEGWSPLSCLITAEWKYIETTRPELYDLRNDPGETVNLADSQADKLREMKDEMNALEASGRVRKGHTVSLSEREQRNLASLGYVRSPEHRKEAGKPLPDLKDRLESFEGFQSALDLCMQGQSESAVAPLYQLIGSEPRYVAPRLLLAQLLRSRGKDEEAENQLLAILDIDPDHEEAHENLGDLYASRGQNELALTHLLKAIKQSPLSVSLHRHTGKVLNALGRKREAAEHSQAAENLWNEQRLRHASRKP